MEIGMRTSLLALHSVTNLIISISVTLTDHHVFSSVGLQLNPVLIMFTIFGFLS